MPDIASILVFPFFLLFIRLGAAIMIFPGYSDPSVNMRVRLIITLVISLIMFPVVQDQLPTLPTETSLFVQYILVEIAIGIMFAISARLFMSAINIAGELIGFTSGFHAATLFDPGSGVSSTAPGLFLAITAGVLIFITGIHHIPIQGIAESYNVFPPGQLPPINDALQAVVKTLSDAFYIGVKMSAPVMIVGFLGYFGFGIFNRLIPQLHVFFVAIPITIVVGIIMLGIGLTSVLTLFMTGLQDHAILFMVQP